MSCSGCCSASGLDSAGLELDSSGLDSGWPTVCHSTTSQVESHMESLTADSSAHCVPLGEALAMKDVKLPGPESRMIVFAGNVFKLKYKLR